MTYTFERSGMPEIGPLITEYFSTLGSGTDGFFDEHIAGANLHMIRRENEPCGFAAERDGLLATFYLRETWLRDAKAVLEQAVEQFSAHKAFVVSGDGAMVSLCLERALLRGKKIELQAYNFRLGGREVRPVAYDGTHLRRIPREEYGKMIQLTNREWEREISSREDQQVWALEDGGRVLGIGLICPHLLRPEVADIGNYVLPEHRRKGVGRSIIMGLTARVLDEGLTPSVGCWYYNTASYLTLTSTGYLPVTRIFCVEL